MSFASERPARTKRWSSRRTAEIAFQPLENRITWVSPAAALWVGAIGFDFAGTIAETDDGFVLSNWAGENEGVFPDLATAKRNLEPAHRAVLREQQDERVRSIPVVAEVAAWLGGTAAIAAVVVWCLLTVQF